MGNIFLYLEPTKRPPCTPPVARFDDMILLGTYHMPFPNGSKKNGIRQGSLAFISPAFCGHQTQAKYYVESDNEHAGERMS